MKLLEFLHKIDEKVILEARIDFLRDKFSAKLQEIGKADPMSRSIKNVFNFLADNDPTKNKQFLQWIISLVIRGQMKIEDASKAKDYLAIFAKFKTKLPGDIRKSRKKLNLLLSN